jgi:hypothetical protein
VSRLLIIVAIFALGVLLLRRSLKRPSSGEPQGRLREEGPQTLVCGDCGARYDPSITGWVCPRCTK